MMADPAALALAPCSPLGATSSDPFPIVRAGGIEIDEKRLPCALAVLSGMREEQDLVEPGAAVGADCEAMERPPRLQIRFLQQVLAGVGASAKPRGEAEQFGHMHQRRPIEFFAPLMGFAEHRAWRL